MSKDVLQFFKYDCKFSTAASSFRPQALNDNNCSFICRSKEIFWRLRHLGVRTCENPIRRMEEAVVGISEIFDGLQLASYALRMNWPLGNPRHDAV